MKVPFVDLAPAFGPIEDEVRAAVDEVIASQWFILGPKVAELEKRIATYCQTEYAVGVASGTDALVLGLRALGVGPGDFVITTPFTFTSTAGSVWQLGATPVFVDIRSDTFNISPEAIAEALRSGKTPAGTRMTATPKVIIPVHLFGQCADMDAIGALAEEHGSAVLEDAAQAIGSRFKDRPAGAMGAAGTISFYPSKNLAAFGDAGMVVTNDERVADHVRQLRVHGSRPGSKYEFEHVGWNSRLDAIQAAVLLVKLRYLDEWISARRASAALYDELLDGCSGVTLPKAVHDMEKDGLSLHTYNQYVIRAKERDALRQHLQKAGVGTDIYYPIPLHLQECFRGLGYREGSLPEAEKAAKDVLALPIFPGITRDQIAYAARTIRNFYG